VRRAALALSIAAIALLVTGSALAAGFGHGKFTGRVVGAKSGSSADVTIKVKKKVSATVILHMNDCTGSGTGITDIPLSTKPFRINKGPAGGGFAIDQTIKANTVAGPAEIDVSMAGGIRKKVVQSTFDAFVSSPHFGSEINCSLSANLKATKK
jgi:hypothetical protein